MILSVIGIVLSVIAIGLIFYFKKDQDMTNDLIDSDVKTVENCYKALMEDFTNYQVETDRKIAELEKQLKIEVNGTGRTIEKLKKDLPSVIRNVVGHIEFAKPLDRK